VHRVLGEGGFGVVYLVYSRETGDVYALKTFRDEFLGDAEKRDRFRREASVWVELERHAYLVRAYLVDEISGRLYIAMEYIAPDEHGLNSLEGYLQRRPPDLAQSLRWAIQICHGMEYAYSRGIRSHRDIKPANILITQEKRVKITDFGLAGVLSAARGTPGIRLSVRGGKLGLPIQTMEGTGFGTPTHMPPEQFTNAAQCDERSDIYAFGVVLYQMATGGQPPFLAPLPKDPSEEEHVRFWREMYRLHSGSGVPKLSSRMFHVIGRCLEKDPGKRYGSFEALRSDLGQILARETGEVITPPGPKEFESWEWNDKGLSLHTLGFHQSALRSFDQALALDPLYVHSWSNKGSSLLALGRFEQALRCYDKALTIDPRYAPAWTNKGHTLNELGRHEEALHSFDQALAVAPGHVLPWSNKGRHLANLGRFQDAIYCYDQALRLDARNAQVWDDKGISLANLGRLEEALRCSDKALELDPMMTLGWGNRGLHLANLGRVPEALHCYDKALELDPKCAGAWYNRGNALLTLHRLEEAVHCYEQALAQDPQLALAWNNKGLVLETVGRHEEAIGCYERAIAQDPGIALVWYNKGNSNFSLRRFEEAIRCYDQALTIEPQYAKAWMNKALTEEELGRRQLAVHSYKQLIAFALAQESSLIEQARQRLRQLGGE
jgi:tetratricopeptide (TPR) repeat protein/predicted Ser/Thr protein kinase